MRVYFYVWSCCACFVVHALRRAQKKIDPAGNDLRAGECLVLVASGRTSLDHRGDSPELENPVGVIPGRGHFMMHLETLDV